MKTCALTLIVVTLLSAAHLLLQSAARAQATRPAQSFTLTKRVEKGAYGTSAYSFRSASQDYEVHRNYVDLVYSNCGLLHVAPVGGEKGRVTDLGEMTLDASPNEAAADAVWNDSSIEPKPGHVYLLQIEDEQGRSVVKFRVDEAVADSLKLAWVGLTITPPPEPAPGEGRRGAAGTMGRCGGRHAAS